MRDWSLLLVLSLAFFSLLQAGLHANGDDINSCGPGPPRKCEIELSRSWKKLADMTSMPTLSRALGEVLLHESENYTDATDSGQISLSSLNDKSWCIAKSFATPDAVQGALDWACGYGGADCDPIQLGSACFIPNTVYSHASYAFNSYYQIHQHASETCDFGGVATVTYEDPSYPGCSYPFRAGQVGAQVGDGSKTPTHIHLVVIVMSLLGLIRVM